MCDEEQITENSIHEEVNANNSKEEDEDYIETINNTFEAAWHEINLGPELMKDYIQYCKTRGNITSLFFTRLNKQLRYTFVN
jgi:hypothetical protein